MPGADMTIQDPNSPLDAPSTTRRWRLWSSVGVVAFVVLAIVIGFFVISSRGEDGVEGALGLNHRHATMPTTTAPDAVPPPTMVAWTAATLDLLANASVEAGRTLAAQTCAACHGAEGIAVAPTFPNLAGQHASAIYKQLRDYAGGQRANAMMAPMAASLDDRQMADLAAYFSSRDAAPGARPSDTPADIVELATNGDPVRGVPPCGSCHATRGAPQGIPLLEGQPVAYLQQQIAAFASGARGNDIYGVMRAVAGMLTPSEIEQLARYYGI